MHHYPHHIGDFNNATRHLTRIERSVYRDMLDLYYDDESPLPEDVDFLCRRIIATSEQERTAVQQVLNEFFILTENGYENDRCNKIICEYKRNAKNKSKAGKASAKARRLMKSKEKEQVTPVEQPLNTSSSGDRNQKPEPKPKPYKYTENDLKIAQDLYLLILRINPNHKEPNYEKWADGIRKINKLDNRTHAEIWETILWVSSHHFWQTVILSPDNLRKKWDKITVQKVARGKPNETSKPVDNSAPGRVRAANRRRAIARGEKPDPDPY